MHPRAAAAVTWLGLASFATPGGLVLAGPQVVPQTVRSDATFEHIGVRWTIDGDDDLDSTMTLEYRLQGQPSYRLAAPAVRAYPTIQVGDGPLGLNYWAASAMFLEPGRTYQLRLSLHDPDGGGGVQTVVASTRAELVANSGGRQLFVVPGSGGGNGSQDNPFKGLQAAANAAQPGDVFHVGAGTYSPFELLQSGAAGNPIVLLGPGNGTAIVDGAGTDRGIITLGDNSETLGFVIVQGLTLRNGHWGIDAQRTHDVAIVNNVIEDVDNGYLNRRDGSDEFNQTLCDNVLEGRTDWPGEGIPGEEGIDLRGTGNVVCHNLVRAFGDCISVNPQTGPSFGNDVFGNDVSECVDDAIEMDENQSNARIWRNRVMNSRMGFSVQPSAGGPAYFFRNEIFNTSDSPIKMHNNTTGYWFFHNTSAKHDNGQSDEGAMWRNAVFRNNLMLGTAYAFEFTTEPDEGFRDFDYNAWGTTRAVGGASAPHFKWNDVRYDDLPALRSGAGVEVHGVDASFVHLENATLGADYTQLIVPGNRDLRLKPGVPELNVGLVLPNVNDPFVLDGEPDLGALEAGRPTPHYGPRTGPTPTRTPIPPPLPAPAPGEGASHLAVLFFIALSLATGIGRGSSDTRRNR